MGRNTNKSSAWLFGCAARREGQAGPPLKLPEIQLSDHERKIKEERTGAASQVIGCTGLSAGADFARVFYVIVVLRMEPAHRS